MVDLGLRKMPRSPDAGLNGESMGNGLEYGKTTIRQFLILANWCGAFVGFPGNYFPGKRLVFLCLVI